jgi:hypothetical protein
MTDTTTKPIWTRCKGSSGKGNGCGQRVFNDHIDIEKHRQHCPADLEREVDALTSKLKDLAERVEQLETTEIILPEQVDLEDVADWPDDEDPDDPDDDFEDVHPTPGSGLYTPASLT